MKFNNLTRRHFLQGLGGMSLSLPFLPSLFSKEALASVVPSNTRCFLALSSTHGGVRDEDIFGYLLGYKNSPHLSLKIQKFLSAGLDPISGLNFPEHNIHYGRLIDFLQTASEAGDTDFDPDGGAKRLSYIVGAKFNPYLTKMNILRGIDLHLQNVGHQEGYNLGNFAATQNGPAVVASPTIDSFMANSKSFYGDTGVSLKQMILGSGNSLSYDVNGLKLPLTSSSTQGLFNTIFGVPGAPVDKSIIDKVLEDYKRFVSPASATGSRISVEDKKSLDRFISHLNSVDQKLNSTLSCSPPARKVNFTNVQYDGKNLNAIWTEYAEIIALAFSCGASKVASGQCRVENLTKLSPDPENYHHHYAHNHITEFIEHRKFNRILTDEMFYHVVSTLDKYSGPTAGSTMLDHSLITWQPQSGIRTHWFANTFVLTAGGAAGNIVTGNFIDYRSQNNLCFPSDHLSIGGRPGAPQNQYLATVLQAMGLPPSEYENIAKFGAPGYGPWVIEKFNANGMIGFPQQMRDQAGKPLPVWTKL